MKDLWSELARRVRAGEQRFEMPFGFEAAVLQRHALMGRERTNPLDYWFPLLRPAALLAVGTAAVCLLVQFQPEPEMPPNQLAQTEELIQLALR